MIFFRRRRPGRHAEDGDVFTETPVEDLEDDEDEADVLLDGLSEEEPPEREAGPYDVADIPDDDTERIDLGSLKIPTVVGVDMRMQLNPDGDPTAVLLVADDSAIELGAFAAPREEGIWDELRAELRTSIAGDGGTAEESKGRYGTELRARVRTPNGPTDIRFIGVDGPRWFLRGLVQGRAVTDPDAGKALEECLDGLVIARDNEARPVREPLPLTLPKEIADQIAAQAEQQSAAAEDEPPRNGKRAGRRR
ncbi:MAG: DUF3710 domain-containing protein [Micromonosporaceae bacterium]